MTIECPCCTNYIKITVEEMANDCIVVCKECGTEIQLEFKYYAKVER